MLFRDQSNVARGLCVVGAAILLFLGVLPARANVYATDIKLNASTNNAAILPGQNLQISYLLNEPATSGLQMQVLSGGAVLWATNLVFGQPGTAGGSNAIVWNGTLQSGASVTAGVYQISITAQAQGYAQWTNTVNTSTNFPVSDPSGIDVNKNTNSPFYGRVFVANAPPPGGVSDSDSLGILKFNADGSPAEDGVFSGGNYPWGAGYDGTKAFFYSPWKIVIAGDDTVYINDFSGQGVVLAFDEVISSNYLTVLNSANYPATNAQLSGLWVSGIGTNTCIWMTDWSGATGITEWDVTTNRTVAPGDTGTEVVGYSLNGGLTFPPWDVSVGANADIFTIQLLDGVQNPSDEAVPRLFCFPSYAGTMDTTNLWSIGSTSDSLENAYGVAVDTTDTYVAVAVRGYLTNGNTYQQLLKGAVNVYYASNGTLVASLGGGTNFPEYFNVAWDNVGNLYATDLTASAWRVFSPPGSNQATTVAVPVVQVYNSFLQPALSNPVSTVAQFNFTLQGQCNVTYLVQSSTNLPSWSNLATNYSTGAVRQLSVPTPQANATFYRAVIPQ